MKIRNVVAAGALAMALLSAPAHAEKMTVVFNVDNATCALCGPIVKGTLERVPGVISVDVQDATDFSGAVATVQFDDAITTTDALIAATTNAGYPSRLAN